MIGRGVIMAGQHRTEAAGLFHGTHLMLFPILVLQA